MNSRKVVIYGTGKYAEALSKRFKLMGRYDVVEYFLVTNKTSNELFDGKMVYSFDEKKDDLVDKDVIIAVSPNQSEEIHRQFRDFHVHSVFQMPREEYRFSESDCSELKKAKSLISVRHDYFYHHCIIPRVSIVVPVYNSENFLKKCIDSILLQSLYDIEIICVDDGSTDRSVEILDEYARKDSRVVVIHKKNRGYGHTINCGVEIARGQFIGIVESDDYISKDMYECLYSLAISHDLDLVKAECFFCWDSINHKVPVHVGKMEQYFNKVLTQKDREVFFGFFMNTWSGIYRRSYLVNNNISHNETPGAAFQDNGFWIQTLCYAKKAMWIPNKLYYYRQDNENSSVMGDGKVDEMGDEYVWVETKLANQGITEDLLVYCYYFHLIRNRGNYFRISDDKKKMFCKRIVEDYHKYGNIISKSFGCNDHNSFRLSPERNAEFAHKDIEEWYYKFVSSPFEYTDEVIKQKKQVLMNIEQADRVYIIGISFFAQRIMRIMHRIGLYDKLSAFICVETSDSSQIGNVPVVNIEDSRIDYKDSLVIIGARSETEEYAENIKLLDNNKVENRLSYEDMADVFYWQI